MSNPSNFWTSEAVSNGHPDKVADQIADAILDAYIAQDPYVRVACEVTLCKDYVLITGEVGSKNNLKVNHIEIAKQKLRQIGYDNDANSFNCNTAEFVDKINQQSTQISDAVVKEGGDIGAGDQGMVFGYACLNPESNYMPFSHFLSFQLIKALEEDRKINKDSIFRPDAKTQVTLKIDSKDKLSLPPYVDTVLVSTCHKEDINKDQLDSEVHRVIDPVLEKYIPKQKPNILINPAGLWTIGGPAADTGLSGRKIVVDQYGSDCPVGGGSFSGKDCTKVDRSGAYAARWVAKNIVAQGYAAECQVQISYAIGVSKPVGLTINCFGTNKFDMSVIHDFVNNNFDLSPKGIIEKLDLRKPIYSKTASGGHFGNNEYPWEHLI